MTLEQLVNLRKLVLTCIHMLQYLMYPVHHSSKSIIQVFLLTTLNEVSMRTDIE